MNMGSIEIDYGMTARCIMKMRMKNHCKGDEDVTIDLLAKKDDMLVSDQKISIHILSV